MQEREREKKSGKVEGKKEERKIKTRFEVNKLFLYTTSNSFY